MGGIADGALSCCLWGQGEDALRPGESTAHRRAKMAVSQPPEIRAVGRNGDRKKASHRKVAIIKT